MDDADVDVVEDGERVCVRHLSRRQHTRKDTRVERQVEILRRLQQRREGGGGIPPRSRSIVRGTSIVALQPDRLGGVIEDRRQRGILEPGQRRFERGSVRECFRGASARGGVETLQECLAGRDEERLVWGCGD